MKARKIIENTYTWNQVKKNLGNRKSKRRIWRWR